MYLFPYSFYTSCGKLSRMKQLMTIFYYQLTVLLDTINFFAPLLSVCRHSTTALTALVQSSQVFLFTRLNKSPYADSYWFLYSAKLTYYSERHLYV